MAKVKILMLADDKASENGSHVLRLEKGSVYEIEDDVAAELVKAKAEGGRGSAEYAKDSAKAEKAKTTSGEEPPADPDAKGKKK